MKCISYTCVNIIPKVSYETNKNQKHKTKTKQQMEPHQLHKSTEEPLATKTNPSCSRGRRKKWCNRNNIKYCKSQGS